MRKYNTDEFVNALTQKMGKQEVPTCPFCQGKKFTTTEQLATISIAKNYGNVELGPFIPAGMLVCENCGHIEFFALGALGLLNKEEGEDNGK